MELKLQGVFDLDSLEAAIVRPGLIFGVDHFFIDAWLPRLGAVRAWLVVALQQACWSGKAAGHSARIGQAELGALCGIGRQRINTLLNQDELMSWFVVARQRNLSRKGRLQANTYTVRLSTPLTPALVSGLSREIAVRLEAGAGSLPEVLAALTAAATRDRRGFIERISLPDGPATGPQSVREIVRPFTGGQELDPATQQAASGLSRVLLRPGARRLETQYFRRNWVPRLGPKAAWLIVAIRRRCFANEHEVRNDFALSKSEAALMLGVSARTIGRVLKNEYLKMFFMTDPDSDAAWRPGRRLLRGRVRMSDPLTPADAGKVEKLARTAPDLPPENRSKCDTAGSQTGQNATGNPANRPECDRATGQNATAIQHMNQHPQNQHLQNQHDNGDGVSVRFNARESLTRIGIHEPKLSALAALAHVTPPYLEAWTTWYAGQSEFRPGWVILQIEAGLWPPGWAEDGTPPAQFPAWPPAPSRPAAVDDSEEPAEAPEEAAGAERLWQAALEYLRPLMSRATFEAWLEDTQVIPAPGSTGDILTVGVKSRYVKDWLENRLAGTVAQALAGTADRPVELKFVVQGKEVN